MPRDSQIQKWTELSYLREMLALLSLPLDVPPVPQSQHGLTPCQRFSPPEADSSANQSLSPVLLTSQVWVCSLLHIHTATTMSHHSPGIPECPLFPWVHSCPSKPCYIPWHTLPWLLIVLQLNSKLLATAYKALCVLVLAFFSNLISSASCRQQQSYFTKDSCPSPDFTHAVSSARNIFLLLSSSLGILLWASS